jgi:hypothetical protein
MNTKATAAGMRKRGGLPAWAVPGPVKALGRLKHSGLPGFESRAAAERLIEETGQTWGYVAIGLADQSRPIKYVNYALDRHMLALRMCIWLREATEADYGAIPPPPPPRRG